MKAKSTHQVRRRMTLRETLKRMFWMPETSCSVQLIGFMAAEMLSASLMISLPPRGPYCWPLT